MFINITEMKYIICCTSENTMNLNVNKIFLMIQLTADNCNELDSFAAKSKLCLLDVSGSWDMWYLCFNLRVCLRSRTKKKKKPASLRVLRGCRPLPRLPLHSPAPCSPAAAKQTCPEKRLCQGNCAKYYFYHAKEVKKKYIFFFLLISGC